MNETMLRDIRSPGEAIVEGLSSLRAQTENIPVPGFDRIILTGSGDSFIAAAALRELLTLHSASTVMALPSLDAARYLTCGSTDLVVAISVSGEVIRTLEAARR